MSILELILEDDTVAGFALLVAVAYGVACYLGLASLPHIPNLF